MDETTGQRILRDMTEEELQQMELDKASKESRMADDEAKAVAKAAVLDRLGLTADEAALLLS